MFHIKSRKHPTLYHSSIKMSILSIISSRHVFLFAFAAARIHAELTLHKPASDLKKRGESTGTRQIVPEVGNNNWNGHYQGRNSFRDNTYASYQNQGYNGQATYEAYPYQEWRQRNAYSVPDYTYHPEKKPMTSSPSYQQNYQDQRGFYSRFNPYPEYHTGYYPYGYNQFEPSSLRFTNSDKQNKETQLSAKKD
jgi:hypothetical protein